MEARYCHFGVMKEVRCIDIVALELDATTILEPIASQGAPSSEKLEIDTLDHWD